MKWRGYYGVERAEFRRRATAKQIVFACQIVMRCITVERISDPYLVLSWSGSQWQVQIRILLCRSPPRSLLGPPSICLNWLAVRLPSVHANVCCILNCFLKLLLWAIPLCYHPPVHLLFTIFSSYSLSNLELSSPSIVHIPYHKQFSHAIATSQLYRSSNDAFCFIFISCLFITCNLSYPRQHPSYLLMPLSSCMV